MGIELEMPMLCLVWQSEQCITVIVVVHFLQKSQVSINQAL